MLRNIFVARARACVCVGVCVDVWMCVFACLCACVCLGVWMRHCTYINYSYIRITLINVTRCPPSPYLCVLSPLAWAAWGELFTGTAVSQQKHIIVVPIDIFIYTIHMCLRYVYTIYCCICYVRYTLRRPGCVLQAVEKAWLAIQLQEIIESCGRKRKQGKRERERDVREDRSLTWRTI